MQLVDLESCDVYGYLKNSLTVLDIDIGSLAFGTRLNNYGNQVFGSMSSQDFAYPDAPRGRVSFDNADFFASRFFEDQQSRERSIRRHRQSHCVRQYLYRTRVQRRQNVYLDSEAHIALIKLLSVSVLGAIVKCCGCDFFGSVLCGMVWQ
jgi:hypothetical protein